ncbi:major facilitator superfamily domain-containing protein, partial [Cercophora samala]
MSTNPSRDPSPSPSARRPLLAAISKSSSRHRSYDSIPDFRTPSTLFLPNISQPQSTFVSQSQSLLLIIYLTTATLLTSFTTGLLTTSLPTISTSLSIPQNLMYWPLSITSLTSGSLLLLSSAISSIIGPRIIFLSGLFLFSLATLACGLSRSFTELVVARGVQGVAMGMALPSSVGIIGGFIEPGKQRNMAFAWMGLGGPVGFSMGLVSGGVMIVGVGWRVGWFGVAGVMGICWAVGWGWVLPEENITVERGVLRGIRDKVDWIGVGLASGGLGGLSYGLVQLSEARSVPKFEVAVSFGVGLGLLGLFPVWMGVAARSHRPVLIPNGIWKSLSFSSVCLMVMMSYAVMQILELYSILFFQKIKDLTALESSVRLLPSMVVGVGINFTLGLVIHRVSARYLVFFTSLACSVSPLLMAMIDPGWSYWLAAFPAQILHPVSSLLDIYQASLIVISQQFEKLGPEMKAVAGGVFNTVAQLGTSLGLAVVGVIAYMVTENSGHEDKEGKNALMAGYRAAFRTAFGIAVATAVIGLVGLKGV